MLLIHTIVNTAQPRAHKRTRREKIWAFTEDGRQMSKNAMDFLNHLCGILQKDNRLKLEGLLTELESVNTTISDTLTLPEDGVGIINRCITLQTAGAVASVHLSISLIQFSVWVCRYVSCILLCIYFLTSFSVQKQNYLMLLPSIQIREYTLGYSNHTTAEVHIWHICVWPVCDSHFLDLIHFIHVTSASPYILLVLAVLESSSACGKLAGADLKCMGPLLRELPSM
jgi:hypothetical protein